MLGFELSLGISDGALDSEGLSLGSDEGFPEGMLLGDTDELKLGNKLSDGAVEGSADVEGFSDVDGYQNA